MNWLPRWFWAFVAIIAVGYIVGTVLVCLAGQFAR